MDDDTIEKELVLRDLYYSPKTGYRSAEHLYELAQHKNSSITRSFVKSWLRTQASFTKYKKWNNPKHYRSTFVRDLGEQVQIDLVVMVKHKTENKGYQYIFMAIELLSCFGFSIPLKNKDGKSTLGALKEFLDQLYRKFGQLPHLLQMDEGTEFLNKDIKPYLEEKGGRSRAPR